MGGAGALRPTFSLAPKARAKSGRDAHEFIVTASVEPSPLQLERVAALARFGASGPVSNPPNAKSEDFAASFKLVFAFTVRGSADLRALCQQAAR